MFLFFYQVFEKTVLEKLTVYYTKIKFVKTLTKFIIIILCVECLIKKLIICEYNNFNPLPRAVLVKKTYIII